MAKKRSKSSYNFGFVSVTAVHTITSKPYKPSKHNIYEGNVAQNMLLFMYQKGL